MFQRVPAHSSKDPFQRVPARSSAFQQSPAESSTCRVCRCPGPYRGALGPSWAPPETHRQVARTQAAAAARSDARHVRDVRVSTLPPGPPDALTAAHRSASSLGPQTVRLRSAGATLSRRHVRERWRGMQGHGRAACGAVPRAVGVAGVLNSVVGLCWFHTVGLAAAPPLTLTINARGGM